jgi:hypothetical protein
MNYHQQFDKDVIVQKQHEDITIQHDYEEGVAQ